MRYAEHVVEEVIVRNNIIDVISGYVKLQKKGNSYMGLCPFHNEKSPSFSVSENKQMYHCFGCGASGSVVTFVMEYENYSFLESIRHLAERIGVKLVEEEDPKRKKQADLRQKLLDINKLAAKYYYLNIHSQRGTQALQYIHNRGLNDEICKKFAIGYAGKSSELYQSIKSKGYTDEVLNQAGLFVFNDDGKVYDKFFNRIMFPILDINNRVIGFGGRVMGDAKPKYLNSPETKVFDKSRTLYGMNIARTSREKFIILCEGYMDVISLHQEGFSNAVAALGTAFTLWHANMLKRYTHDVLIVFDNDEAGIKATLRAIPMLKQAGIHVKIVDMSPFKDPDEFIKAQGVEKFQERIHIAKNSFTYEIDMLETQYDLNNPESKTEFYNAVARKIVVFSEEIERNNYIEAIDRRYHVGFDNMRKLVNKIGATTGFVELEPVIVHDKKEIKDDGIKKSQRLLLTWLIDYPYLFDKLNGIIDENDFEDELYSKVAKQLFGQYRTLGHVTPAQIINQFNNIEEQKEVAKMFNTMIPDLDENELKIALNETIIKVKKYSLESKAERITDISELQKNISDLTKVQKLHISF